jgi:branched-chain amino acid aminotransferase
MNKCILNGKVVEDRNIISVYNGSFLYGINCFEGMRGYWNSKAERMILLDLDHHINRLYLSAERMRLNFRLSKEEFALQLRHFINGNNLRENVYVRMTLFIDGETSWMEQNNISYLISFKSMKSNLTSEFISDKYTLKVSSIIRNSEKATSPSIKAGGNYLNSRYARIEAQEHGFDDALMVNHNGFISESTGSCIFFFRDGSLHTPSLNCDILPSITRNRIITLCKKHGIDVVEGAYPIEYLLSSEAAFLCGSMIELMPISRIENVEFETSNSRIFQMILKLFVDSLSAEQI